MAEVVGEESQEQQHDQPPQHQPEDDHTEAASATVEAEGEEGETKSASAAAAATPPPSFPSLSLNIWPPTQRTRDAVIHRLVETLSVPSILSKRYGTVPPDEAASLARQIEQDAFSAASDAGSAAASDDDGFEMLQIYSKEISRRMLESVKARASSAPPSAAAATDAVPSAAVSGEEVSSVESESSPA